MNIFILDIDPIKCAKYHCDKHVIKMILESAQMLCTVSLMYGGDAPYKPTHSKHPCTLWITESMENWNWLVALSKELNKEYRYRFSRNINHKSYDVIKSLKTPNLPNCPLTPFVQAMPEQYRIKLKPILAYRKFYVYEKGHFCKWTKRKRPDWWKDFII